MICLCATLKPSKHDAEVRRLREAWVRSGKEAQLRRLCVSATRYVIKGSEPLEVFWLLDTLDRRSAQLIKDHFSSLWDIEICDVESQPVKQALR